MSRPSWWHFWTWFREIRERRRLLRAWKEAKKDNEREERRRRKFLEDRVLEQLLLALKDPSRMREEKPFEWNTKG